MEQFTRILQAVKADIDFQPEIGLVLGSGLGFFHRSVEARHTIKYSEIPGFPKSTVAGHAGSFLFGELQGKKVVVMQGRVHYYEGYEMPETVLPIRLMMALGARKLILTNAAGGIRPGIRVNTLMGIRDHIAAFVPSPLRGDNPDGGPRFPDMSRVYDPEYLALFLALAKEQGLEATTGVYLQTPGPQYETPAEVALYGKLGADAVGMSTAAEAIVARHAGARILGISRISNAAAGLGGALSHEEVTKTAEEIEQGFTQLVKSIVAEI